MRHELVHAMTSRLWPLDGYGDVPGWAVEGYATFVERLGNPVRQAAERAELRGYVRRGWFTGQLPRSDTFQSVPDRVRYNYLVSASVFDVVTARRSLSAATEFYARFAAVTEDSRLRALDVGTGQRACRQVRGMSTAEFTRVWGNHVRAL